MITPPPTRERAHVTRIRRAFALLIVISALGATPARAQSPLQGARALDLGGDLVVGGEAERYLRVLQLAGLAAMQPWSIRPVFAQSAAGFVMPTVHPWSSRWQSPGADQAAGANGTDHAAKVFTFSLLRPAARLAYNSAFPFEIVTGPTWAGRGLTADFEAGFVVQLSRLRLQLAPKAFMAQNQAFALAANGQTGESVYRDARFPGVIDAPQRFGAQAYSRIDAGNSTISLDLSRVSIGISTAAQSWGPGRDYPLILSANAGGFPHAFIATTRPVDLGIVRIGARLIAGRLSQSQYAPVPAGATKRWASGLVVAVMPKGLEGLELGVARFLEGLSASGIPEWRNVARMFGTAVYAPPGPVNLAEENQVASGFFRWAVPRSGLELYGEIYREDFAIDTRRFAQNPDDLATYMLGFQYATASGPARVRVVRLEIVNGELSSANRVGRGARIGNAGLLTAPNPPYLHGTVLQGHTNQGLILGSPEAYGGAAWRIGVDEYDARGRTSVGLERRMRLDWLPATVTDTLAPVHPDVIYGLRAERVRFVGTREYAVTLMPMIDLNRDIRRGNDLFNLSVAVSIRGLR